MSTQGIQGYSNPNDVHLLLCCDEGKDADMLRLLHRNGVAASAVGIGVYKGEAPEVVYAIRAQDFIMVQHDIAKFIANQESILRLGKLKGMNHRDASLVYLTDGRITARHENVGTWLEVTREEALANDGYSMFNGHWFTTKHNPADCAEEEKERALTQVLFDLRMELFHTVKSRANQRQGNVLAASYDALLGRTLPDGRVITVAVLSDAAHQHK